MSAVHVTYTLVVQAHIPKHDQYTEKKSQNKIGAKKVLLE